MEFFFVTLVVVLELMSFASPAVIPANVLPTSGECGTSLSIETNESNVTVLGESPWNCLIEYRNSKNQTDGLCNCVLINQHYVLTAAQCVAERKDVPDWKDTADWVPHSILLGKLNRTTDPDCSDGVCVQRIRMSKIIIHPQFNLASNNQLHNIALVRMEVPVTYNDFVKPICLPIESRLRAKKNNEETLELSSWGTDLAGDKPKVKLSIRAVKQEDCVRAFHGLIDITDTQFCGIGGERGAFDNVLAGAPLVATDNSNPKQMSKYLVGLSSFELFTPVFTNVSDYVDWVQSAMEP